MKQKLSTILATLTSALLLAGTAHAHGVEPKASPNGGQIREAGKYHFELVVAKDGTDAKESPVVVYVTDSANAKVPTLGATGTATILFGKAKVGVTLTPDGDNRMKGTAKYASPTDMKVILSINLAGKAAEQARFTPLTVAPAKDGHSVHKH